MSDPEEIKNMLVENLIEWRDRVAKEASEKALEKGQLKGEALVVSRLLKLKFGPLDETSKKRIAEADSDTLLRWADRVLTVEKLSDIFGED